MATPSPRFVCFCFCWFFFLLVFCLYPWIHCDWSLRCVDRFRLSTRRPGNVFNGPRRSRPRWRSPWPRGPGTPTPAAPTAARPFEAPPAEAPLMVPVAPRPRPRPRRQRLARSRLRRPRLRWRLTRSDAERWRFVICHQRWHILIWFIYLFIDLSKYSNGSCIEQRNLNRKWHFLWSSSNEYWW